MFLLFVTVSFGGTTFLAVNITGVRRTFFQETNIKGQITAIGMSPGKISFSCVPDLSALGRSVAIDSSTGAISGFLWVVGDFGPFNFIATDSLGNVAVSPPVFITVTSGGFVTSHFSGVTQCERGTACSVTPQFSATSAPKSITRNGGSVPLNMSYVPRDGSYSGVLLFNTRLGSYKMFTLVVFPGDWELNVNIDMTVLVVAPLVLDLSFLQPTCG